MGMKPDGYVLLGIIDLLKADQNEASKISSVKIVTLLPVVDVAESQAEFRFMLGWSKEFRLEQLVLVLRKDVGRSALSFSVVSHTFYQDRPAAQTLERQSQSGLYSRLTSSLGSIFRGAAGVMQTTAPDPLRDARAEVKCLLLVGDIQSESYDSCLAVSGSVLIQASLTNVHQELWRRNYSDEIKEVYSRLSQNKAF